MVSDGKNDKTDRESDKADSETAEWFQDDQANSAYYATNDKTKQIAEENGATHMAVGTYIERFDSVSMKESKYVITLVSWFRWDGDSSLDMAHHFDVYKGDITNLTVLHDDHSDGSNYQLVRYKITVNKVFHTARFPLGSHQLRIYLESTRAANEVIFTEDTTSPSSVNDGAQIAGYRIIDTDYGVVSHEYASQGSSTIGTPVTSEYLSAVSIQRDGFGLYIKCFMAMYGTSIWVLIMLYICTNHRVDPLGMIPAALFGTVSNIMVGAALVPDALDMGLLEFVNAWGVLTIIIAALAIIEINHIRSEYGRQDENFANFFGRIIFAEVTIFAVLGNIILPLSAMI